MAATQLASTTTNQSQKNGKLVDTDHAGDMTLRSKDGKTIVTSDVIAKIAGMAIREVDGVHALVSFGAGQTISSFARSLGRKEPFDLGVHVEVGEVEAAVDCRIITVYGTPIPDVAAGIRHALKQNIQRLTGLTVKEVNIEIVDLFFPGDPEEEVVAVTPARVR